MPIKKEEYIKTVQRPYPPLWSSLVLAGSTNEKYYKPFLWKPYARRNTIILDSIWYYWKYAEDEGRRLVGKEWSSRKRLNQIIKLFTKRERDLINFTKKNFKVLCQKYEAYMPAIGLPYLAESLFYERTKELLEKKLSPLETEELLSLLNIPLKDNFYRKEEYDLVTTKDIKKHVKKYEWMLSRYGIDHPYTEKDACQKLLGINRHKFLEKYNKEKQAIKQAIIKAKKILGKNDAYLIDGLQFIVFYRTHRSDIVNKVAYLYIPFLKKIALKNGISYNELLICTKDEILDGKIPSKTLLADRAKGNAIITFNNKVRCVVGKKYETLVKVFQEKVKKREIIKGNIVSRGVIRGIVKIILECNDFSKMNHGDILVTSMTTPEMMLVMKKAAAFITDEGGITCHAAIVARELKKPCIIGTKIATKVLRDGDLVEVDAERGTVKIIKKA